MTSVATFPSSGHDRFAAAKTEGRPHYPALDLLRGASMILVVVAHASVPYMELRLPGLLWTVRDASRNYAFDLLFWAGVSVGMPLFFTISGFLAALVVEEKGATVFLADRTRRIIVPMLAGALTILPPIYVVWGLGWIVTGRSVVHSFFRFRYRDREISSYFAGPAHLWFLEYLTIMLLGYYLYRKAIPRKSSPPGVFPWFSPLAPFALAVPSALLFWAGQRRFGLDPVMDMRNWFVPDGYRLAHHTMFFLVGTRLYAAREGLQRSARFGPTLLILAVLCFYVRMVILGNVLTGHRTIIDQVMLCISGGLFAWLAVYGALGSAQRWYRRPIPIVNILSGSSYWIYLIHFPIVGLIQLRLWGVPWSATSKFSIVLGLTLAIGLLSDRLVVRHSKIGRWLYGRKPAVILKPNRVAMVDESPALLPV